jgi:hypothetical protein
MKKHWRKHFNSKQLYGALIGAFFVFILTTPVIAATTHLYERLSPPAHWFEYVAVIPLKNEFERGETLKFTSEIEYNQDIRMYWQDQPWCLNPDGIRKYPVQRWPVVGTELKRASITGQPDENGKLPFWEYLAAEIDHDATACHMCFVAIGVTDFGYEKRESGCTQWFEVNQ